MILYLSFGHRRLTLRWGVVVSATNLSVGTPTTIEVGRHRWVMLIQNALDQRLSFLTGSFQIGNAKSMQMVVA